MLHKCDLTVRGRLCRVCGNKSPHTSAFPRKARLFFFLFPPPNTRTKLKRLLFRFVENQAKKDTSHCRKLSVPNDGKADLRKTGGIFSSPHLPRTHYTNVPLSELNHRSFFHLHLLPKETLSCHIHEHTHPRLFPFAQGNDATANSINVSPQKRCYTRMPLMWFDLWAA